MCNASDFVKVNPKSKTGKLVYSLPLNEIKDKLINFPDLYKEDSTCRHYNTVFIQNYSDRFLLSGCINCSFIWLEEGFDSFESQRKRRIEIFEENKLRIKGSK